MPISRSVQLEPLASGVVPVFAISVGNYHGVAVLTTLLRVHQGLQDARGQVVVVARGPATARPLRMAGLSDSIVIVDSIDAALDGTVRAHRDPQSSDREVLPLRKSNEEDVPR